MNKFITVLARETLQDDGITLEYLIATMSMRQIRFSTLEQIQTKLKEHTGKKINIVLCNRKVLFGELKKVESENLSFLNMRQKLVCLRLSDISEVYLDVK